MRARKVYCKFESNLLQRLVSAMPVAVAMHWTMQSMLYADPTERRFRLALDLLLTLLLGATFVVWLPGLVAWPLALVIAHTLNFLFNSHLVALCKDFGLVRHTYEEYRRYVEGFEARAQREPSIQEIELRGGLTRQSWSPYSDLDVRLIRRPGFINGLRACWFLLRERSHALFAWFPLDAYVRDPAPHALSSQDDAGRQPATIREAARAVAEGDGPKPAPAPTADLFGRQDRSSRAAVAPAQNGDSHGNGTGPQRHSLIYLRGAILHDYGQTSYRIAYYLPEFGFDTTLVQLGLKAEERMEQGIKVVVLPMRQLPVISSLWINLLAFRYLRAHRCDVLLCNPGLIFAATLYKRLHPATRLVVDVRSIPVEVKGIQGWLMDRAFASAVRARELDGLSVITDGTLEMVYGRYKGRYDVPTVIWPSGVDERVFDPAISGERVRRQLGLDGRFVLMYHGSLTPNRGLGLVLEAVARLVAQGETRAKVVFIGKRTPHQAKLEAQAEALGIQDYVLFLGPVPHEEIAEYVAAADAGLDPLPDNPWWNYSSPMKVYEYLRMGKPVLASDIHAHRNISSAVLLTRERDVEALAEAIRRLMDADEATLAHLRQQALEAGARNTWRKRAATLSDFLHRYLLNTTPL